METYQLSFTALKGFQNLPAQGDLIVYESANVALNAETRVRVKPDSGGEVWLKPGQWFRATQMVSNWSIKSFNGNDVIDAFFVIGSGDFGDANTLNRFTLDATFANSVKVTNSVAERVPVAIDPAAPLLIGNTVAQRVPVAIDPAAPLLIGNTVAQRVPVSLDSTQTLNIAGSIVAYNAQYTSVTNSVANTAIQLVSAASNVNGVVLEKFEMLGVGGSVGAFSIIAKATAPVNVGDGAILLADNISTASKVYSLDLSKNGRIKAPPGMGIWYISTVTDSISLRDALFTIL